MSAALDQVEIARLPAVARELAEVVGLPAAARLVEALGGTTYPIPKRETRRGELRYAYLAGIVGAEAADRLVRRYGGTELYVPRCADALRHARDTAICREYDRLIADMSGNAAVQRLARAHSLSDRRIFGILKRVPEAAGHEEHGLAKQIKLERWLKND